MDLEQILKICPALKHKTLSPEDHSVIDCVSCSGAIISENDSFLLIEGEFLLMIYFAFQKRTFPKLPIRATNIALLDYLEVSNLIRSEILQICKACNSTSKFDDEITLICDMCGGNDILVGSKEYYMTFEFLIHFTNKVTYEQLQILQTRIPVTEIHKLLVDGVDNTLFGE